MKNQFVAYQKGYPLNYQQESLSKYMNPPYWVNQMEVAIKRDVSLRICIDPRSLNIALKREH